MIEKGYVTYESNNGIAWIEFFHPAHNSLPGHILDELKNAINKAGNDDQAKIVVLKSGGDRTFCAGASFDELQAITTENEGKQFFMGFANVINAIRTCPKIVIGRIQGKAVGGGVGIAAACDYAIATKYASIKLSELAIGIGPFVIGPAVERKIGLSAFSNLAINATEWQTAEWAKSKGLYMEAMDSIEQVDDYINHFAEKLTSSNPEALRLLKHVFWEGTEDWNNLLTLRAEMSGQLVLSDHARKAINGFLKA